MFKKPSEFIETVLNISLTEYEKLRLDTSNEALDWFNLKTRPRHTVDRRLIVYPDDKITFDRRCGKTYCQLSVFEAYLEAQLTNKPAVVNYGMQLVNINEME